MGAKLGLRPGQQGKTATLGNTPRTPVSLSTAPRRVSVVSDTAQYRMGAPGSSPAAQALQRASLYIFGEKSQTKV